MTCQSHLFRLSALIVALTALSLTAPAQKRVEQKRPDKKLISAAQTFSLEIRDVVKLDEKATPTSTGRLVPVRARVRIVIHEDLVDKAAEKVVCELVTLNTDNRRAVAENKALPPLVGLKRGVEREETIEWLLPMNKDVFARDFDVQLKLNGRLLARKQGSFAK
jgi:hypothetical protein